MDHLICFKCSKTLYNLDQLKTHYRRIHAINLKSINKSGFRCSVFDCRKHFVLFSSLIRHLRFNHNVAENEPVVDNVVQNNMQFIPNNEVVPPEDENPNIEAPIVNNYNTPERPFDIVALASKMIANLRSNSTFTGANIDRIIDEADEFLSEVLNYVKRKISECCQMTIDTPEVKNLLDELTVNNIFLSLRGIDNHIKSLKKYCTYIEPVEMYLGLRDEQRFNRKSKKYEMKQVPESFHYVSIIETLKLIMSHKEIRDYVNSEESSVRGNLKNFRDGESFRYNPFFARHPNALRIQLYYDDIVVNNPLGSKVHPHKLGVFYFVIQNLPLYINCFLGGIHLLIIAYTADITKYKFQKILKPFLNELQELESASGVPIQIDDECITLRGTIACVCADGLAAHQMFGLLNPSTRHFCRLCMISREDLINGTAEEFQTRTKELYEQQVIEVQGNPILSTRTGVRENSCLHTSRYFHCTNNFLFDPMHDILEGVGQLDLKLVISHFVLSQDYALDVETLNSRIHLFNYGLSEIKNKPSANFTLVNLRNLKDHTIQEKAVQTWCLLRVLPFLVSDIVSENDEYLQLILLMNRINEIVFAPRLDVSILPYLSELIQDHENLFRKLFAGTVDAINKLHHLRHYPNCIRKSGPMRPLSCLLFEAKHSALKRHGSICCN